MTKDFTDKSDARDIILLDDHPVEPTFREAESSFIYLRSEEYGPRGNAIQGNRLQPCRPLRVSVVKRIYYFPPKLSQTDGLFPFHSPSVSIGGLLARPDSVVALHVV